MAQRPAAKLRMVAVQRRETHCPTLVGWAAVELGRRPVAGRIGRRMVRSTSGGRLHAAPHRVDRAARLVAGEEQDVSIDLAAELARIAAVTAAKDADIERLRAEVAGLREDHDALLQFAKHVRRYGDTGIASMAIAVLAARKGEA